MDSLSKKILIIDDEEDIVDLVYTFIQSPMHQIKKMTNPLDAFQELKNHNYDIVISDFHMPKKSGIDILEDLIKIKKNIPFFIFISGNSDPIILEKASSLGASDIVQKPFSKLEILKSIEKIYERRNDKIFDIMMMMKNVIGVNITEDKKNVFETRIMRRMRQVNIHSLEEYFDFFQNNKSVEINELTSFFTTHTTHFFREKNHFDFLCLERFPDLIKKGKKEIKIWSAACSSGEEVYSIGICFQEFLKKSGQKNEIQIKILGSDIDFNILKDASSGIYQKETIENIEPHIQNEYFHKGTKNLSGYVKVKDFVYDHCQFKQINLVGHDLPKEKFDIIFLRNVLIYFDDKSIFRIISNILKCLHDDGCLIIGHSESLLDRNLDIKIIGHSIYEHKSKKEHEIKIKKETNENKKIRVFSIDDSAAIRLSLKRIFDEKYGFEFVGSAENPKALSKPLTKDFVDIVTLDIEMPHQDGLSYLKSIKDKDHPPVVMISSINYEKGTEYLDCFELGAKDYIEKPLKTDLLQEAERIRCVIENVYKGKKKNSFSLIKKNNQIEQDEFLKIYYKKNDHFLDLIVIGASTGGVEALKIVLEKFPKECPPVVVVQHIPSGFSNTFALRLNTLCNVKVTEAQHEELLEYNHIYIAPGGKQTSIIKKGNKLFLNIFEDLSHNPHKPSVDVLFSSAAKLPPNVRISSAILTGMGSDGAKGLLELKNRGAWTIAQDEETCVVFGMPKVAIEIGAYEEILPLEEISHALFKQFKKKSD